MDSYESPLHIVSAQVSELGMTFAQKGVESKSNEIPAVQELLEELDIGGCIIVANALNCQKNTGKAVISGGADYVLSVKDNHPCLKQDIADYVGDAALRGIMDTASRTEKNRDRIEKRSAFVTEETEWLTGREEWEGLSCIGAVHTEFETKKEKQRNGIIIFPAGGSQRQSCYTMPAWNGRWKRCTGCWMFILGRISAVWKTGISSRIKYASKSCN